MLKKLRANIKKISKFSASITKTQLVKLKKLWKTKSNNEESIVKIIELSPNLSENEISNFLMFNAEKYTGLPQHEITIDYKILKKPPEANKIVTEITVTKNKKKQNLKKKILNTLLFTFAIILSWHIFLLHKNSLALKQQHFLDTSLTKIKQNYSIVESQKKHLLQLESFFLEINNLDKKAKYNAELFAEISKVIPAKMYLTQLNTNNEIIIFSGKALSLETVSLFMQNIAKSKILKNPELQEIKNDTYDNTLKNFTVTANKKL
jgi:Tfp pilus assembly protein PilN